MNVEEFLKPNRNEESTSSADAVVSENAEPQELPLADVEPAESQELEVSQAVVEELAKDSVEQKEIIASLRRQVNAQQREIASLRVKLEEQNDTLGKIGETLAKNADSPASTKITLLERDPELPDRFEGETRDHILEALREARNTAESDGRLRHAQILESVLCANEPNGNLAKKREELKKLFEDNANLVTGPVIETLKNLGISHKNGEEYLLPAEILKRTY